MRSELISGCVGCWWETRYQTVRNDRDSSVDCWCVCVGGCGWGQEELKGILEVGYAKIAPLKIIFGRAQPACVPPSSPHSHFFSLSEDWITTMTVPSRYPVPMEEHVAAESSSSPPVKRMKMTKLSNNRLDQDEDSTVTSVRRHPLGVRPAGNAYTSSVNQKDSSGLFATLPDELIAQFLEVLEPRDLLRLGGTCRALHAFTRNEELWRALFVE